MHPGSWLLGLTLLFLTSCVSFHKDWREALHQPPTHDLTGPWEGHWESTATGHRGRLRCVVGPPDAPGDPSSYRFHYWARWGIFSGAFDTLHPVQETAPQEWAFQGQSDLGFLGGVYRQEGRATPSRFEADYHSDLGDRGRMIMSRPEHWTHSPHRDGARPSNGHPPLQDQGPR